MTLTGALSVVFFIVCSAFPAAQAADRDCYPITARDLQRPGAPRFEQFPVPLSRVTPAPVDVNSSAAARRYRTVLRAGAREGPNFAGHYTIIAWGCGSSCTEFAVVDSLTGRVYFPREFTVTSGVHLAADDFERAANGEGLWALRYRSDSALLIVLGALDEDPAREGATYYVFRDGTFERVYSSYFKKRWCGPTAR